MDMDKDLKIVSQALMPELRYAYYRRCERFRRNGVQCKAPALKEGRLCYKHAGQQALAERRERQVRALALPGKIIGWRNVRPALWKVTQAMLDGRIDTVTAGRLMIELQGKT